MPTQPREISIPRLRSFLLVLEIVFRLLLGAADNRVSANFLFTFYTTIWVLVKLLFHQLKENISTVCHTEISYFREGDK